MFLQETHFVCYQRKTQVIGNKEYHVLLYHSLTD